MNKLLINHIGYEADGPKKAVLSCDTAQGTAPFALVCARTGEAVLSGTTQRIGPVANWRTGDYHEIHFDGACVSGQYFITCDLPTGQVRSMPFEIRENLLGFYTLSDMANYFKTQRSSGEMLMDDSQLPFAGEREGIFDRHGGWYDAAGDAGIHMSHLSHGTYFNPQQHPFSAYVFFKAHGLMGESGNDLYAILRRRYLDEGFWGVDFIMRMRTDKGAILRSIRRAGGLDAVHTSRRVGFEYKGSSRQFGKADTAQEEIITDESYEASLRCGGGLCIAALAIAGRHFYTSADYTQDEYVLAAKESYAYLEAHNELHTNDGKWNLLDEYCALMALTELYITTGEYAYRVKGREMAQRVMAHFVPTQAGMGYLSVNDTDRPFFHAADAGLPVVALLTFYDIENDEAQRAAILALCEKVMRHQIHITGNVANPFGYARQLVVNRAGNKHEQFFFPHDTEVAPWWQGESARQGSLASAAQMLKERTGAADLGGALAAFAADQLNWILGLNPFDSCMMLGHGRNHVRYFFKGEFTFMGAPGGISNGITSAMDDDEGILLFAQPTQEIDDNWRWGEQWIPHASWFMYAVALLKK